MIFDTMILGGVAGLALWFAANALILKMLSLSKTRHKWSCKCVSCQINWDQVC